MPLTAIITDLPDYTSMHLPPLSMNVQCKFLSINSLIRHELRLVGLCVVARSRRLIRMLRVHLSTSVLHRHLKHEKNKKKTRFYLPSTRVHSEKRKITPSPLMCNISSKSDLFRLIAISSSVSSYAYQCLG